MSASTDTLVEAARRLGQATPGELAEELPDEVFQHVATALVKAYLVKRESGAELAPVTREVTATEASVAASALMAAADLEFFEVTLWNSWGRL